MVVVESQHHLCDEREVVKTHSHVSSLIPYQEADKMYLMEINGIKQKDNLKNKPRLTHFVSYKERIMKTIIFVFQFFTRPVPTPEFTIMIYIVIIVHEIH